jgi:hypothetical protein
VRLAREAEVKTFSTVAFALVAALSGSLAASAQTEQPAVHQDHHIYQPHHAVHHHHYAAAPAQAAEPAPVVTAPAPQAGPFGLALPHIAPYPDGKGDEDGLSEDEDDCNKGCIDGNGAD